MGVTDNLKRWYIAGIADMLVHNCQNDLFQTFVLASLPISFHCNGMQVINVGRYKNVRKTEIVNYG